MKSSSIRTHRKTALVLLASSFALFSACSKNTADLELAAAKKAIQDAKASGASDCATANYQAAEAAIAEAQALAQKGDVEGAKKKAGEAKAQADQAKASSGPGCAEKKKGEGDDDGPNGKAGGDQNANASMNLKLDDVLQTIYFDYNEANIREDSKAVLQKVADILIKQPGVKIEIEGHCDVRGSTEYNLSLGERRARSVEKYLTTQGVKADQLQIISYGEERPIDLGDTEEAHQKNRRAELHKLQ